MLKPMLAHERREPFDDDRWLFEQKYDGQRVLVEVERPVVRAWSRYGNEHTDFGFLKALAERVTVDRVLLDGEAVVYDEQGRPDVQRVGTKAYAPQTVYVAFDLLEEGRTSLMALPLEARKERLLRVLLTGGPIQIAPHVIGEGTRLYQAVSEQGLEGIMAKRRASVYRPGIRSWDWLKVKVIEPVAFVVGGYAFGAKGELSLAVGLYGPDGLEYCGKVGTGFAGDFKDVFLASIAPIERPRNPFSTPMEPGIRFLEPVLVAACEVRGWSHSGKGRHVSFKRFCPDVDPEACRRNGHAQVG